MIFLLLFIEFFKTGLFSVGGGLATVPFLAAMGEKYGWFDEKLLSNMIAVGESTPGPIGVNMATFVGYTVANESYGIWGGLLGGIIATTGLVLPSVIVIIIVAKILNAFKENKYVNDAFYAIRPAVTGMIASAGLLMIKSALVADGGLLGFINLKAVILFAVLFVAIKKIKLHPVFFIIAAGVVGAVFSF